MGISPDASSVAVDVAISDEFHSVHLAVPRARRLVNYEADSNLFAIL